MNDAPGERQPFVIRRAHGRAPGLDGEIADQQYKTAAPPPDPAEGSQRQIRQVRQSRQAPAPSPQPTAMEAQQKERAVPPHELVLADLRMQRDAIDTAIAALEALYR